MCRRILPLLVLLAFMLSLYGAGELREMECKQLPEPAVFTVMRSNPEDGGLIIYSSIPNLRFDSNMNGIVKEIAKPEEGKYTLFLKTMTSQVIIIKAINYIELHIPVRNLKAQEVRYFSVEPKFTDSDFGTGSYTIKSEPSDAQLSVLGLLIKDVKTPYEMKDIATNTYRVTLKKDRYQDKDVVIRVEKDKSQEKTINLTPNWADLTITSEPSNCKVYINGQLKGNTPLDYKGVINGLDPGSYNIRIEKPNEFFLDSAKTLVLNADEQKKEHFVLENISGTLSFKKAEKQYNVYLDNTFKGQLAGQANVRLLRGSYQICCAVNEEDAEFYADWQTRVEVKANENIDIMPVFKSEYATLTLKSNLGPVEVSLDNKVHRLLSSRLSSKLFPKDYTLKVQKTGEKAYAYQIWQEKISLKDKEEKTIQVEIKPIMAKLNLNSNIEGTEYTIRDVELNRNVADRSKSDQHHLLIGQYEVIASARNYLAESRIVNLKDSRSENLRFSLMTYEGSMQQKKRFWDINMYSGLLLTALNGAAIYYCDSQVKDNYDAYKQANSVSAAVSFYDKTMSWEDRYKMATISISAPVAYTLYSFIKSRIYNNKIKIRNDT